MDVLLANPARLEALSAEQRGWLEEAARDAARSSSLADTDAEALVDSCRAGARFAEASDADLAALEAAFAPTYAKLDQHPETKAFIERIRTLKESTPPDPELAIPRLHRHGPGASRRWHGDGARVPERHLPLRAHQGGRSEGRRARSERVPTDQHLDPEDGHFDANGGFTGATRWTGTGSPSARRRLHDHVDVHRRRRGQHRPRPCPSVDPGDAFESGSHTVWTKID